MSVIATYQAETGTPVLANLGPTSDLARQIEHGATADLFLSADEAWADYLAKRDLVAERKELLTNELVLIVPADSPVSLAQLNELSKTKVQRLALAGPAIPAGRYAREALTAAGIWQDLQSRVIDGGDVRATLTYVVRSEADAGIVYATDVQGNAKARVVLRIPPKYHTPIRYPLILTRRESMKSEARRFYDYLSTPKSLEVFSRAGFGVVPAPAGQTSKGDKQQ